MGPGIDVQHILYAPHTLSAHLGNYLSLPHPWPPSLLLTPGILSRMRCCPSPSTPPTGRPAVVTSSADDPPVVRSGPACAARLAPGHPVFDVPQAADPHSVLAPTRLPQTAATCAAPWAHWCAAPPRSCDPAGPRQTATECGPASADAVPRLIRSSENVRSSSVKSILYLLLAIVLLQ